MLSLFIRFVIIIAIVISATDVIVFYHIQKNGIQSLTWQFVISVIVITIIPIVINLWYWLIFKQRKKNKGNLAKKSKHKMRIHMGMD